MNEELTPGILGSQSESPDFHFQKPSKKRWKRTLNPDPMQFAALRSLADHVIEQLCERHSHLDQDPLSTVGSDFSVVGQ